MLSMQFRTIVHLTLHDLHGLIDLHRDFMQARLFDYECITVEGKNSQPRVVAFGKFAGMAGMIDCFQGLGLKLLAEGIKSD